MEEIGMITQVLKESINNKIIQLSQERETLEAAMKILSGEGGFRAQVGELKCEKAPKTRRKKRKALVAGSEADLFLSAIKNNIREDAFTTRKVAEIAYNTTNVNRKQADRAAGTMLLLTKRKYVERLKEKAISSDGARKSYQYILVNA